MKILLILCMVFAALYAKEVDGLVKKDLKFLFVIDDVGFELEKKLSALEYDTSSNYDIKLEINSITPKYAEYETVSAIIPNIDGDFNILSKEELKDLAEQVERDDAMKKIDFLKQYDLIISISDDRGGQKSNDKLIFTITDQSSSSPVSYPIVINFSEISKLDNILRGIFIEYLNKNFPLQSKMIRY